MSRTRIKVCGLTTPEMILASCDAGADAVGFVFVEGSPRFIEPEVASDYLFGLPPLVTAVGVVQDLSVDDYSDLEQRCPCTLMQLHGKEPEKTVRACGPGVMKAIAFDATTIDRDLALWAGVEEVDALLIDGSVPGSGEAIAWSVLAGAMDRFGRDGLPPIFLAGGLNPENVADAVRTVRPYAVDVSSGVERERGVKDARLIERFCDAVREADRG